MKNKLAIFSWAMYDLANTFFAMNIVSLYFALWVTVDKQGKDISYSLAIAISTVFMIIGMPILGIISDRLNKRMPFLIYATLVCIILTASLGFVNNLTLGLLIFAIANFCYQLASAFYNVLLTHISQKEDMGKVSGYGIALGYVGTLLALILVRPFVLKHGYQAAFLPTAIFFLLFSLPCFFFVKDKKVYQNNNIKLNFLEMFRDFKNTLINLKQFPGFLDFFLAIFLSLNAINTIIIFMSVYGKKVIGLTDIELTNFFIVSSLFSILGSFLSGAMTDKLGSKKTFKIVFLLWTTTLVLGAFSFNKGIYWIVGFLGGLSLGSTWGVGRTLAIEIFPKERLGEFFGIYGISGKFGSIFGPLVWGYVVWQFEGLGVWKYRLAICTLLIFIFSGYYFLRKIPEKIKND